MEFSIGIGFEQIEPKINPPTCISLQAARKITDSVSD